MHDAQSVLRKFVQNLIAASPTLCGIFEAPVTIATDSARLTVKPAVIHPGRRNEDWPPENLLIKWRGHAGYGFNPVNRVFALTLTYLFGHVDAAGGVKTRP